VVWQEDEPVAWPSSVSLYFVSKLAAREVKVVLTGEGCDEIFGGYARYGHYLKFERQAALWDKFPAALRSRVARFIAESPALGAVLRRKLSHTPLARRSGFASLYLENFLAAFSRQELARFTGQAGDPFAAYLSRYESYSDGPALQRLLYADQKTYLVELLRKQDRMSMACSIESRVPLLDHTFVEFAASLASNLKLHGANGKYIFKRMAERLLPRSIVYRPKMGFPTPVSGWLAGPYRERVASLVGGRRAFCRQFLTREGADQLMDQTRSGMHDTTDRVWRLLTLELWGRRFFCGERPSLM
jgi:asparagine synthase (glutamine-hydrolysing)